MQDLTGNQCRLGKTEVVSFPGKDMSSCILNYLQLIWRDSRAAIQQCRSYQEVKKARTSFSVSCKVSVCLTLNSFQTRHISVAITRRLAFNQHCTHSAHITIPNIGIPFYQNLGQGITGVHHNLDCAGPQKIAGVCIFYCGWSYIKTAIQRKASFINIRKYWVQKITCLFLTFACVAKYKTMRTSRIGQECLFGVDETGQNSFGSARRGQWDLKDKCVTHLYEAVCIQLWQHYMWAHKAGPCMIPNKTLCLNQMLLHEEFSVHLSQCDFII